MAHLKLIIFRNIIMAAEEPSGKRTRKNRNNGNNNENNGYWNYRVRPVDAPYAQMTPNLEQSIADLRERINVKKTEERRAMRDHEKKKETHRIYLLKNRGNRSAAVTKQRQLLEKESDLATRKWLAIGREIESLETEVKQLLRPGHVEQNHNSQGTNSQGTNSQGNNSQGRRQRRRYENDIPIYRSNRPIVNEPLPEGFKEVPIPKPNMAECEAVDPITGSAFNPEQTVKLSDKMCYTYGAIVKQYNKRLGERRPFESPYTRKVFEEEDIAIVNTIKKMVEDGRIVLDKDDDNVTGGSKTRRRRRHILRTRKSKSRKHR